MKLYALDITDAKFIAGQMFNAASKPRTDALNTFVRMGAELKQIHVIPFMNLKKGLKIRILCWVNKFKVFVDFIRFFRKIKNSIVLIQYPFIGVSEQTQRFILKKLKRNNNKLITLFHDIEILRHPSEVHTRCDQNMINSSDICIMHSPAMEKAVVEYGMNFGKIVILEFFDYISNIEIPSQRNLKNVKLIFAGNLSKAKFLRKLDTLSYNDNFEIYLYGIKNKNIKLCEHAVYKGKFTADDFRSIEGNWGLVWDGDDVNKCTGEFGEYMRINAPFKLSLYLAANRPVVVWSNSAMADYVRKYNLGICVESLEDIPSEVAKLTEEQLNKIIDSVAIASNEVRCGGKLENAIKKSLNFIGANEVLKCHNYNGLS